MSKWRKDARIDGGQNEVVEQLRDIPGVKVAVGYDDFIVSYKGVLKWVEWKNIEREVMKCGRIRKGALTKAEKERLCDFHGPYFVAWTLEQILKEIGVTS